MRYKNRILVLDVETTGFDPAQHACIEIGAVLLDETLSQISEFGSLVAPWDGAKTMPGAMLVNKIALNDLMTAPSVFEAVNNFNNFVSADETLPLVAGWNIWFDVAFVKSLYQRASVTWPFKHRLLDVQSIVSFHLQMEAVSQEKAISDILGEKQLHRALTDAKHTSRLLKHMANKFLI